MIADELAREGGRAARPAAADEILEGGEREHEARLPPEARDELGDLLVVGAAREATLDRLGEKDDRAGYEARVEGARPLRRSASAAVRALSYVPESPAEMDRTRTRS